MFAAICVVPEARADLCREDLRLFPGREVAACGGFVVVDEVVVRLLCPAALSLVVLARKGAHGGRDGDVGGVVQADLVFPVQAGRRDCRAGQPVQRDVV
jgi:hypothetical protein